MSAHKRAADDGLDAFLGLKADSRRAQPGESRNLAAAGQSLSDIEKVLFQAAPQDLSEAIKPKKKHKKKNLM